jgi:hypothetical protein
VLDQQGLGLVAVAGREDVLGTEGAKQVLDDFPCVFIVVSDKDLGGLEIYLAAVKHNQSPEFRFIEI